MVVRGGRIIAVGKNLQNDSDFSSSEKFDLHGAAVLPGFTDAHTHIAFITAMRGNVKLDNLSSLEDALDKVKVYSSRLKKDEWVVGEGYSPDRWKRYIQPDKFMLDKVTGGRPAAIFSKDQHNVWVNSKALELAKITASTHDPAGGRIMRHENGEPSGILKEIPAYFPVFKLIKPPRSSRMKKQYMELLSEAYGKGVTGVVSFDGPDALTFFDDMAQRNKLGLRINYYPPPTLISKVSKTSLKNRYGGDYFRINGFKMFADGALGSQSALCFNKFIGSKDNYGVQTNTKTEFLKQIKCAAKLGLPMAIHAIGDRAISNVLDCYEKAPALPFPRRHRIEHVQLMRRKDIPRLKRLNITASVQPSHCPSDIKLIEKYWGKRGRNCYIFKSLLSAGIPLAFGSDAPIEPLNPIAGIDAAVNRKAAGMKKPFYPDECLSIAEAVYGFTAGAAYAVGQEFERGRLLPGYMADFIVLSDDIYKTAHSKTKSIEILATILNGKAVFSHHASRLNI